MRNKEKIQKLEERIIKFYDVHRGFRAVIEELGNIRLEELDSKIEKAIKSKNIEEYISLKKDRDNFNEKLKEVDWY